MMRVLALEPYYGGSHRAFLDGWSSRSGHQWTTLTLPPYKWKWRMRHAAITFAEQVAHEMDDGAEWDVLFCSDMLNLAEFLGLAPACVRRLPAIVYFHENQLTYPVQVEREYDYHFVFTNITTALAATRVWFNSAFHRDEFLAALPGFLNRMPDHVPLGAVERIREKADVRSPGIGDFPPRGARPAGPIRILWAARWEHDKNPGDFFAALRILVRQGVEFRVSVIGEQYREYPAVFDAARDQFKDYISRWGYQESREEYEAALTEADVFVSTANHEFFGISAVEAIVAGAYPVLPERLAYPEILNCVEDAALYFYDGSPERLAAKLSELAGRMAAGELWCGGGDEPASMVDRFRWERVVADLDRALSDTLAE
jgi:glycosyltransferase involved in cell wall biosynthesis